MIHLFNCPAMCLCSSLVPRIFHWKDGLLQSHTSRLLFSGTVRGEAVPVDGLKKQVPRGLGSTEKYFHRGTSTSIEKADPPPDLDFFPYYIFHRKFLYSIHTPKDWLVSSFRSRMSFKKNLYDFLGRSRQKGLCANKMSAFTWTLC